VDALRRYRAILAGAPTELDARLRIGDTLAALGERELATDVYRAATAGYAFSRFRFPGRRTGLMSFLVSQMFPGVLTLIPLYIILVKWLGLGSTRIGLVLVYTTTAIPFCVWMLKGYFDTIPRDLEEAAMVDGTTRTGAFVAS